MNKKGAILAVLLAGAMSFGVVATAGCKQHGDGHTHAWTDYKSDGAETHTRRSKCLDHATVTETKAHVYDNDQDASCNDCGYERTVGGGDEGGDEKPDVPDEPEKPVVLNEDTAISLSIGESKEISAAEGAVFTSLHTNVATVDSKGKITAKTAGVAKITATTSNSVITCTVIVMTPVGGNSQTVTKDPFSFNKTVDIGSVSTTPNTPEVSDPNAAEFRVEFSDGAVTQYVANGNTVVEPLVERSGQYLTGWKASGATTNYDFYAPVTSNMVLTAQWADLPAGINMLDGNYESIAVEFDGKAATSTVSYRLHGSSDSWHQIDSELIRDSGGNVRADIVGIKEGVYDVKVNSTEITGGVPVARYDRSGYAHFDRKSTEQAYKGVGAYNDDGTLKDNALVIYVTDENKDYVMDEVCAENDDVKMFNIPYSGYGKDWGGKTASGIGWWLNNNQYTSNNAASSSNKQPSNTYDATNGGKLGIKSVDRPVVVRFIGKVNTPEGCTSLTEDEGGINGDNGHMARMKNVKNITLEGVGDDAEIYGWGFHYIAGTDAKNGEGTSFEVRNLTFNAYPEDAVGMEGQATSSAITAPVERCWIHNNTFLPGYCANPKESDKKEGDGSCDFKRGQYFTCSYNYFEYCHKTNLIGSSDSSLQYNMTYHHNLWYQCGSRIPLTRRANVHFYNNYVFGNPAETTTPYSHIAKPSLSYVHSLRASCYLYSEYNYYEGSKQILRGASEGGDGKFYNNTYYACSDQKATITEVSSREQAVSNSCKYQTTDYSKFDTNSTQFYYDSTAKKTKAEILDDSVGARLRAVLYAGAQGHGQTMAKLESMNTSSPSTSTSVSGLKGKGQVYTFSVAANTTLVIDATGVDPQVIRSDGKVILAPFSGSRTVVLSAGTYMVCSGIKDKEITINSLKIEEDSEAAKLERIEAAKKAISAIPDRITRGSGTVIEQAEAAYANLITQEGKDAIGAELVERLQKARAAYEEIMVEYVIKRIDYIGTVTAASKSDIDSAYTAYEALSATAKGKVTNYSKLTAANTAFSAFKGDAVKDAINRLPKAAEFGLITDSKPAIQLARDLYNEALNEYLTLDKEEDAEIIKTIDINPVTAAIETLTAALKPFDVKDMIAAIDEAAADYMSKAGALKTAYEALTAEQKAMLTEAEKAIYDKAVAAYTEYASKAVTISFNSGYEDDYTKRSDLVEVTSYATKDKYGTYNGNKYKIVYLDSSCQIKIKAQGSARKMVLHFLSGTSIDVNGKKYAVTGETVTVELAANTDYTIKKDSASNNFLFLIELLPA